MMPWPPPLSSSPPTAVATTGSHCSTAAATPFGGGELQWLSRVLTMPPDWLPGEEGRETSMDETERVPSSLKQDIGPILRAAKEIEDTNPRVAYLCRFTAFERAHSSDPNSTGRGVRQFKTYLIHRLEKDEQGTQRRLASTDAKEIQRFFEEYYRENLKEGRETKNQEEILRHHGTASVLYDVLKTMIPEIYHPEFAKGLENEAWFLHYNILPLNITGPTQPVMEIPEIKAAVELLRSTDNLPKLEGPTVNGLFDWLWHTFGFQKSNVENQKEHLILLLANIDMRKGGSAHRSEIHNHVIHSDTVTSLTRKIFQNYISWCQYLHLESNIKIPRGTSTQQPEILYIGLYLLIWGEASNVRFMPECLCYIFHHMAKKLYDIISVRRKSPLSIPSRREDAFLQLIIQPIFNVMQKEAAMSKCGTTSHSKWRNYDDLNEYFWSKKCFEQLKWPMVLTADFFAVPTKYKNEIQMYDTVGRSRRIPKTNFVEHRTFFLLFRSFDRMWTFFTLAFQAMVIIAWNPSGSLYAIFEPTVFRNVVTIFITYAFLNFLQATFEIILNWKAWRSLECSEIVRYILKFVIALAWLIILPTTYISSIKNPTGLVKFFSSWIGNSQSESIYNFAVALYVLPNIFNALFFIFLPFRKALERSNSRIVRFLLWWSQPKLYVARGMYEDKCSLLKYILFWTLLLICKLTFSFYVEISPLVGATRTIMLLGRGSYEHGFFPYLQHNLGVVITVWAPSAMVYFMDTQIWYVLFSTICGGVSGALSGLGEIRTLGMLRSRFEAIPRALVENLVPKHGSQPNTSEHEDGKKNHIDEFSDIWNAFIISLRDEDLISNSERSLLMVPSSMTMGETTVFQWPPFLLASKIPLALDMAKSVKKNDEELRKRISKDPYTYSAVIECYETLLNILYSLVNQPSDKKVIDQIHDVIKTSIRRQSVVKEFWLDELPKLIAKFDELLGLLLKHYHEDMKRKIVILLQDIIEMITQDIMKNGQGILKDETIVNQHFANINLDSVKGRAWREKCVRLQLLLTTKESAIYVPTNFEARRRITFFANSLFMKMPRAPQVRSMMSFSVLTPYFKEEVLFSAADLYKKNEDGISILFYLRKIYPDEWKNFLERINFKPKDEDSLKSNMDKICPWASYRGQTLIRTVRGMMYYRRALEIQCIQDKADLDKLDRNEIVESSREARAIADIKFTYVVSCQAYGMQKKSMNPKDRACYLNILNLMTTYPSLRVAYIDEEEVLTDFGITEKTYYSVLVKGVCRKYDEEVYRIKLPGKPTDIGDGKPENQNHAIIFTRGEALQAIDMNQDNYLEETFKMRNLLEEFESEKHVKYKPTILGLREHFFTGSVSSLASFMSIQDTSFATIGQRILANPLKVRFHYGRSDIFDRLFHITRGGISKASKTINLSEGIFSGFNSIMREGNVTHHEYMQVGKGRDVGMNQISSFEANVANGNGEQTLSRDIYRLGHRFDFYRMLSVYFTTVGLYFNSMVSVLTVYVFLYGRLYLVISGLEKSILLDQHTQENIKPLERALASQSLFQLGLLLVLPMFMEAGLEKGFGTALGEFVIMQLQLASVFFTFQLGTKAHYYTRKILHGGAKYRPTSRGFVVYHAKFAENYRMYSRSHFVKGVELLILLVVYLAYGSTYHSSSLYLFITFSIWFLVVSWLFAPFIFNPSCFEPQKIDDDWADWKKWMGNRGIAMSADQSWEVWWESEYEHLRKTSFHALILEIILSLRFLIYQCGIVYYLNIAYPTESILVYAWSLVMVCVLVVLKMESTAQQKFGTDLSLMFRILNALVFLGSVIAMAVLFVVGNLTISDVVVSILGFVPTGWCIILIGQACSPWLKKTMLWDSIMELGRVYDDMMGLVLFLPIVLLSWLPFVSEFQTRLLFNQGFSQGLQISRILAGQQDVGDIE